MFSNLNGWHLVILLAIVLLLFGAPRLPGLAKSVGQSLRIFRGEVKTLRDDTSRPAPDEADAATTVASADAAGESRAG